MSFDIKKTIKNLEKNNIKTYFVESKKDVVPLIEKIVAEGSSVAVGGSVTLSETGVLEHLRCGRYTFFDRYEEGLLPDGIKDVFRKSFGVDAYFCSTNAITEQGELYNVDRTGNRVGAISYGPENVIIVAGVNKIVKNLDEAVKRVKTISAPKNCIRLNCNTYCAQKGYCADVDGGMGKGCDSKERICTHYLVTSKQLNPERIKVILVNEELGY